MAPTPGTAGRPNRSPRRTRLAAQIVVLSVLVLAAGLAVGLRLRQEGRSRPTSVASPRRTAAPFAYVGRWPFFPRWVRPGITRATFAKALLRSLQAPVCRNNLVALLAWMQFENTVAEFNPMATTLDLAGSRRFNSVGVRDYGSLPIGVRATTLTLLQGASVFGYSSIIDDLRACASPYATARAIASSPWGSRPGPFLVWEAQHDSAAMASILLGLQFWGISHPSGRPHAGWPTSSSR